VTKRVDGKSTTPVSHSTTPLPTFSDAPALTRRGCWGYLAFRMSTCDLDLRKVPHAFVDRLTEALCYAA
jgi:hypothetical protein